MRARSDVDEDGARPPVIVAMAASSGGPKALATVLENLGGLDAGILVVQHLRSQFMDGFVEWMTRVSALRVHVARNGAPIRGGTVYLGPANLHLRLGAGTRIRLDTKPDVTHCPSADELFRSMANTAPGRSIGVLLTGMGEDGAKGLLELRERGGMTIVQDQASSAVYGMPKAAARLDAADLILPLDQIAPAIMRAVSSRRP